MAETESRLPVVGGRSLALRGGVAVVLSVAANAGLVVASNAAGIAPGFRAIAIPPVAFLSAAGAAGAFVVYALLERYVTDPRRTFLRVAAAVLVLSFLPDLALLSVDPAATVAGVAVLVVMHCVVAGVSVGLVLAGESGGEPA
jgi:hypothetical protein